MVVGHRLVHNSVGWINDVEKRIFLFVRPYRLHFFTGDNYYRQSKPDFGPAVSVMGHGATGRICCAGAGAFG